MISTHRSASVHPGADAFFSRVSGVEQHKPAREHKIGQPKGVIEYGWGAVAYGVLHTYVYTCVYVCVCVGSPVSVVHQYVSVHTM